MGCGGSADNGRNEIVNYRRPKISIRVGVSVENPDSIKPKIVFIFGGPGSRKGRIIDDLVAMYGFTLLSIEELVLQQLPKNIENSHTTHKIDTTIAIQKMLREDPTKLTLDWGLRLVENCISAGSPDSHYLVDAMPNLRFLLIEDFFLKDCSEEMQRFEERFDTQTTSCRSRQNVHFMLPT
ncbi:PREDICTED: UMP-CMP kinase 3-like isoform X2 [Priapulus caudatus]|uniref:UMP-CMP kinase 3-like isoform X2 n=1 Tax=Priapulus caudatus TaxID=37621 RepID=A0ABM1EE97_PRICU|nr:PREDICTED: UMP-CMP kinase 3-like isoform X2 [Priapulus caudatus]